MNFNRPRIFILVGLLLVLAALTYEVVAHSRVLAADVRFENMLVALRVPLLVSLFSDITMLGNLIPVISITVFVGLILVFRPRLQRFLTGFATTMLGTGISVYFLKESIARPRPSGLIPVMNEPGFSFPSGHATVSIALYGSIALFLCAVYPRYRLWTLIGAAAFALLLGFTRLYLGVHFPSDVIAGYALGGAWLILGAEVTARQRRPTY